MAKDPKATIRSQRYLARHPWIRNYRFSRIRAKRKGWEHSLTIQDFKNLWEKHKAEDMDCPSIDRLDTKKGYVLGNCRFIERRLNSSLGNRGKIPWNKGLTGIKTSNKKIKV